MSRPQMFHPVTHHMVNIYSDVFMQLLDQCYTEEDLLHNRVENVENIPLTHNTDVDLEIMLHLKDNDLTKLCRVNQYTQQLSQRQDFWFKKLQQRGFDFQ